MEHIQQTTTRAPRSIVPGIVFFLFGVGIAVIPSAVYKSYEAMPNMVMQCYFTASAEIVTGAVIALSGLLYFLSRSPKVNAILSAVVILGAISTILLPTAITGLCADAMMTCHMVTLPILIVASVLTGVFGAVGLGISVVKLRRSKDVASETETSETETGVGD